MKKRLLILLSIFFALQVCSGQQNIGGVLDDFISKSVGGLTGGQIQTLSTVEQQLVKSFDILLSDTKKFEKTVKKECSVFPEGTLYPYALPSLAYANIAFSNPKKKEYARKQMIKLIDLAIPQVVKKVRPPDRNLLKLRNYKNHATYLGTLNLMLSTFQLATGDRRYEELNEAISVLLYSALTKKNGYPIESYPFYSWNFDTILALASLDAYERIHGGNRSHLITEKHFAWIKRYGLHMTTGLPYSTGWRGSEETRSLPRGCDLSMRICLMANFAPDKTKELYRKYVEFHWLDRVIVSGFAEWPNGKSNRQDVDSGPLFMGIGSTASSMGLGTTIAVGDKAREKALTKELFLVQSLVHLMAAGDSSNSNAKSTDQWFRGFGIKPSQKYVTSFLYGDAALLYAVTWTKYPTKSKMVKGRTEGQ